MELLFFFSTFFFGKHTQVHQYEMIIDVYDEDMIGKDDLIGRAAVSLLPVFKKGFADQWIPIGTRDKWGKKVAAGELHIEFDFVAPPNFSFPQRRPDIDSFDHTERVDREKKAILDAEEEGKAQESFQDAIGVDRPQTASETIQSKEDAERLEKLGLAPGQEKPKRKQGSTDEFTDQEIEDAFAFIDLDRNRFLGAGMKETHFCSLETYSLENSFFSLFFFVMSFFFFFFFLILNPLP